MFGQDGGSPCDVRKLKNKAREAAYMFRDGYLSSKAYQRRQLRRERPQRSESRQSAWAKFRRDRGGAGGEPEPDYDGEAEVEEAARHEAEMWSSLMYEQLLRDESECLAGYQEDDPCVWCPLCEASPLDCGGCFLCPRCGAGFRRVDGEGLEHLEVKIFQALERHDLGGCVCRPQFLLTPADLPADVSLLLVCAACSLSYDISGARLDL